MSERQDMGASADADRAATPSGPSPAVSGIAGIPSAVRDLIRVLREVSADAMYRGGGFGTPFSVAKALGFIEEHNVKKPCRSCGQPVHDYTYAKVTISGQAYLSLASGMSACGQDPEEGLEAKPASPVGDSRDAQPPSGDS